MFNRSKRIVVITPVYEDSNASAQLFMELGRLYSHNLICVVVDDGSVHNPLSAESLISFGIPMVLLTLKRNVGHQRAIAIGLNYVANEMVGDYYTVVMDSDGEDLPEYIDDLVDGLENENVDIVVAQRKQRTDSRFFKFFYVVYKNVFKLLTGHTISFGNFMAMKPAAIHRLVSMRELWIHLAGTVLLSKLRVCFKPLRRGPRYAGKSKMNFTSLALHGFRAVMIFSEDVLVRVGITCAFVAFLSMMASIAAIVLKIIGFATPGWFSVALGILLLVLLQTGALTLMTLLQTGVLNSGSISKTDYHDYIDRVDSVTPQLLDAA